MRVFKNLMGDGSKIDAGEIVVKDIDLINALVKGFYTLNNIPRFNDIDLNDQTGGIIYAGLNISNAPKDYMIIITIFYDNSKWQLGLHPGELFIYIRSYYKNDWTIWKKFESIVL